MDRYPKMKKRNAFCCHLKTFVFRFQLVTRLSYIFLDADW